MESPSSKPRHVIRRANLQALMSAQETHGPTAFARAIGKPKMRGHLTHIRDGLRNMGDELAADIEAALNLPEGWMSEQHPVAGERPALYLVAQVTSQEMLSHDLPLIPWEEIVHHDVPEIFRSQLPDEALAPDFPAGTEIVWTTRRKVAPGRLVLVRDRHGQLHARQCHQGRAPGHWIASATNPVYISFDNQSDDLVVVAVYKGRLEPDD